MPSLGTLPAKLKDDLTALRRDIEREAMRGYHATARALAETYQRKMKAYEDSQK